mmetsp:Transcript_4102/g.7904  ORF Transcript_4102/g.7904 Transcript_4102/m.7904 type:complete len:98 (+) Transcript_4102:134-427(+)
MKTQITPSQPTEPASLEGSISFRPVTLNDSLRLSNQKKRWSQADDSTVAKQLKTIFHQLTVTLDQLEGDTTLGLDGLDFDLVVLFPEAPSSAFQPQQ